MWDLSSLTRDRTQAPCFGSLESITGAPGTSLSLLFINQRKWKLLSGVWLFATPRTVCSLPGSSVHGILQAILLEWGSPRILEWVTCPFSRVYSQPRNRNCIAGRFFTSWTTGNMEKEVATHSHILAGKSHVAWWATVHGVTKNWIQLSDWAQNPKSKPLNYTYLGRDSIM